MLLALLPACTDSPGPVSSWMDLYTPARSACEDTKGLADEKCRAHLQQDIGLDEESFAAAGEEEQAELLLESLYDILMQENSEAPPKGETWYDMVTNYVVTTEFEATSDDLLGSFRKKTGEMFIASGSEFITHSFVPVNGEVIPVEVPRPVLMGTVMVHEASHAFAPNHLDECDGHCDADMDGPFGIAARWSYGWAIGNREEVQIWEYLGALGFTYMTCELVIVEPGYPCDEIYQAAKM